MKLIIILIVLFLLEIDLFAQFNSNLKFIFIPHPRSDIEGVLPAIANIDFTKYDVKMLGGDLTWTTSEDSSTMVYCDNIFDLSNPNTLWSLGNHDVQRGDRDLIKSFTGRESFYTYYRDDITFIVLDTELDANGSSSTFIKGDQLQMVKNVCDSIAESSFLILLHHRFMWMINNDYFSTRLTDSIAASSRSLDTTNFYVDIYPQLQKVKNKGIPVHVFGGDRSSINIVYSPEDSITFYAARLKGDLADSINNVIILNYIQQKKEITTDFVPLADLSTTVNLEAFSHLLKKFVLRQNYPNPFNPATVISYQLLQAGNVELNIYNILGRKIKTLVKSRQQAGYYTYTWDAKNYSSGVYIYTLKTKSFVQSHKMLLLR